LSDISEASELTGLTMVNSRRLAREDTERDRIEVTKGYYEKPK
jgi:hypothetical protein